MCKYCKSEDVYNDDDGTYFLLEGCLKCGMETFKKIEEECCNEVESYSITKYENACEMEYGLTTMCRCDYEGDYILVTVKEFFEGSGKVEECLAWLCVIDMDINFTECPQCGSEKNLFYEVNIEEEAATVSIICPKCHCIDKHDL